MHPIICVCCTFLHFISISPNNQTIQYFQITATFQVDRLSIYVQLFLHQHYCCKSKNAALKCQILHIYWLHICISFHPYIFILFPSLGYKMIKIGLRREKAPFPDIQSFRSNAPSNLVSDVEMCTSITSITTLDIIII